MCRSKGSTNKTNFHYRVYEKAIGVRYYFTRQEIADDYGVSLSLIRRKLIDPSHVGYLEFMNDVEITRCKKPAYEPKLIIYDD